jgi:hypothetical protein
MTQQQRTLVFHQELMYDPKQKFLWIDDGSGFGTLIETKSEHTMRKPQEHNLIKFQLTSATAPPSCLEPNWMPSEPVYHFKLNFWGTN